MFPGVSLLKLFALMARDLDVTRFAAGGTHLWPIARSCFGARKIDNNLAPEDRPAALRRLDERIETRYRAMIDSSPATIDRDLAVFDSAPLPRAEDGDGVLIFSRAEDHYLRTPQGFYAPVLDPWHEVAASAWPCRKAELAGPRFDLAQPRAIPTVPLAAPAIDPARVAQLEELRAAARALALAMVQWLQRELDYAYADFPPELDAYLTGLWIEKEQLGGLLAANRPRLVITSCTYLRPTLSMTWAARERGVLVADAQHGGNGPFHMGYTHWRDVPDQGYRLLPDLYLVWDAVSANNVGRWLPQQGTRPSIAVSGRFDLEATRRAALGPEGRSPLELATHGSARTILVTLQPLPSTGLTPLLIAVMKAAPADWTWLIRSHPMAVAWKRADMLPATIEAALREHGIARAESQLSTALPLAAILPLVDHHLTGFSGTVQECAAFGISTTFVHGAARFSFPTYIDSGAAEIATTAEAVLARIAQSSKEKGGASLAEAPRDPERPRRILTRILG